MTVDRRPSKLASSPRLARRSSSKLLEYLAMRRHSRRNSRKSSLSLAWFPQPAESTRKKYLKKVPRPKNCFMTYRMEKQHEIIAENPDVDNKEISRIAGRLWRQEPEEVRQKYRELSRKLQEEHAMMYPDYKFQPRKRVMEPESTTHCPERSRLRKRTKVNKKKSKPKARRERAPSHSLVAELPYPCTVPDLDGSSDSEIIDEYDSDDDYIPPSSSRFHSGPTRVPSLPPNEDDGRSEHHLEAPEARTPKVLLSELEEYPNPFEVRSEQEYEEASEASAVDLSLDMDGISPWSTIEDSPREEISFQNPCYSMADLHPPAYPDSIDPVVVEQLKMEAIPDSVQSYNPFQYQHFPVDWTSHPYTMDPSIAFNAHAEYTSIKAESVNEEAGRFYYLRENEGVILPVLPPNFPIHRPAYPSGLSYMS